MRIFLNFYEVESLKLLLPMAQGFKIFQRFNEPDMECHTGDHKNCDMVKLVGWQMKIGLN